MEQVGLARPAPHLPARGRWYHALHAAASVCLHLAAIVIVAALVAQTSRDQRSAAAVPSQARPVVPSSRLVFISRLPAVSRGGGGGGNRQSAPIQRAQGVGRDPLTLRISKPQLTQPRDGDDVAPLPGVLLDARPFASGTQDLPGLPDGGVPLSGSLGPGSGGGVGEGAGTGIGSGIGPGLGPGAGGGSGGGIYRPGGTVTPPRPTLLVKPRYTDDALARRIQGTVVLDVVVKSDGRPTSIVVVRSLDPGGLDEAAVTAAREWRFEPGRLAGTPVDVAVTLLLDFHIQ